ncbi:MAG: carbohydrate ABC transporter permease [Candidatus Bipolaricaulota bacterium]|nr:carbohydrate ABC transporter permease [Candidatus Bipolaricaulota bacterium]MBS3792832.1 carbohydrate ABC transporter permease [Candidatus Bipolaricaulota bacterium]
MGGENWKRVIVYISAVLVFLFTFGPFVGVFLASIVPETALITRPPAWFSKGFTLANYRYIFTGDIPKGFATKGTARSRVSQEALQIPRTLANSFIIAFGTMLVNLIFGSMAAFAYSRLRFPGRGETFMFILLSRLIPLVALAVPYYLIIQTLGLLDTFWSLIMIHSVLTLPFTILILTVYFRGIPEDLEDQALVDGCNQFQMFLRVIIPLSLPSLVAAALFSFMLSYSEFLFGLLISSTTSTKPISVVLSSLSNNPDVSISLLNSSIIVAIIPSIILAIVVWRFVIQDLILGALKG